MRLTTPDSAGLKRALEAVLLASRQPLSLGDLRRVFADQLAVDLLPALLDELRAEWDADARSNCCRWRVAGASARAPS
jgi:chromosome segregation and condensation protein ScpB